MSLVKICSFAILLPYTIQYSDTSSYDEFTFGAGAGKYAYSDCSGIHASSFSDAGATVTHKFNAPFRIGVHAFVGELENKGSTVAFAYPDLALDLNYLSIGTTGIRVGSLERMYIELAALDQPPIFSGKGALRLGVGFGPTGPFSRFWIGTNGIPYSNLGLATQWEFRLQDNEFIFFNGRYGTYLKLPEYGVSVGIRLRH